MKETDTGGSRRLEEKVFLKRRAEEQEADTGTRGASSKFTPTVVQPFNLSMSKGRPIYIDEEPVRNTGQLSSFSIGWGLWMEVFFEPVLYYVASHTMLSPEPLDSSVFALTLDPWILKDSFETAGSLWQCHRIELGTSGSRYQRLFVVELLLYRFVTT
jgi:hypothetical protein